MAIETEALKSKWVPEFGPLLKGLDEVEKKYKKLESAQKKVGKTAESAFKPMPAQTGKANKELGGMVANMGSLATKLGIAGLAFKAFDIGLQAVTAASDRAESASKSALVFGENLKTVQSDLKVFGEQANSTVGELTDLATGFGVTFNAFEVGAKQSSDMSVTLTKLSADLASLNNIQGGAAEAADRLQKGLAGEHDVLKPLQVIINESILKQELQAMGMDKLTGMALEQAKVMARYNIIMRQTEIAQGDAIRTADGFANSSRGLQAELKQLTEEFGELLLPFAEYIVMAGKDAVGATTEAVKILKDLGGQIQTINELTEKNIALDQAAEGQALIDTLSETTTNTRDLGLQLESMRGNFNNVMSAVVQGSNSLEEYNKNLDKIRQVNATLASRLELTQEQFDNVKVTIQSTNPVLEEYNQNVSNLEVSRKFGSVEALGEVRTAAFIANQEIEKTIRLNDRLSAGAAPQREAVAGSAEANRITAENKRAEEAAEAAEERRREAQKTLTTLTKTLDSFTRNMESVISGVVGEGFGALEGLGLDFLGDEEGVGENARRLADIALGRFDSEAAKLLQQERPDLFQALFASDDPAAMAQNILKDFQAGIDTFGLIDIDKAVANVKRILVGQQATADVNKQVMEQLLAEGFDEAAIAQALGDKMSTAQEALSGGLVDAEHQLKLQELTQNVDVFGESSEVATDKLKQGVESTNKPNEDLIVQLNEMLAIIGRIDYLAQTATASIGGMGASVGVGGAGNASPPPPAGSPPITSPATAPTSPTISPTAPAPISTAPILNQAAQAGGGAINRQPLTIQLDGTPLASLMATVANNQITKLTRA